MKALPTFFLLAIGVWGQQPAVENAKLETRPFTGNLDGQLRQLGTGPFWAAYAEPMIPGRRGSMCWNNQDENAPLRLEGPTTLVVLIRVENTQVDQLRTVSLDCRLDGGGLPLRRSPMSSSAASTGPRATSFHRNSSVHTF